MTDSPAEGLGTAGTWSRTALLLGLLFGLAFAVVTPPSQAPDEPAHFRRAYEISEGRLLGRRVGAQVGDDLPESVVRVSHDFLEGIRLPSGRRLPPNRILEAFRVELEPKRRAFIAFPTASYGPAAYVPDALAMAAGRALTQSTLALFYLGRLANVLAGAFLLALAVRRASCRPEMFFLIGLLPMAVFLMASHSADAVTNGLCFLLTATLLGGGQEERGPIGWRSVIGWTVLAVLLSLAKPGYFLLSGLVFLIPADRFGGRGRKVLCGAVVAASALAAAAAWTAAVAHLHAPVAPQLNARPSDQWGRLASDPAGFALFALTGLVRSFPQLAEHFVGRLGWLDVPLPRALVVAHGLILLTVAITGGKLATLAGVWRRALLAAILLATMLVVSAALYVYSSAAGASTIPIQGRYFLPVAPAAFLALGNRRWHARWRQRRMLLACWVAVVLLIALAAALGAYYF